ncbi:MAG: hypothetical protein KDJ52_12110 [Anaerolineae bacterium]|nr:hypothetical protein [Anaerolineae bacterium]
MGTHDTLKIDADLLRKAMRAWDSSPKLGKHPLAKLHIVEARRKEAGYSNTLENRGRALREVIRDGIRTLPAPSNSDSSPEKSERPYVILTERFIKKRNWDYVAAQLGLARRTYYEEQAAALDLLVEILRQREEAIINRPSPQMDLAAALDYLAQLPLDVPPKPGPLPPGSLMPLSRNPLFVGRQDDLATLATTLKGGESIAIGQTETAATTGLGGIGKTQLASEFVHRYGRFFAGGVYWLSFADAKAIPAEVAACGGKGAMDLRPDFNELSLQDQLRLVVAAWQQPMPRLLVFDNCEDPELLAQWRPAVGGCRILVTSRRIDWEAALGVRILALNVLSQAESLELLRQHCPDADENILAAIAKELGYLPLALHLAGSYMARYRRAISPADYLNQLRDPALLEHPSLKQRGISPTGHIQNIYRTIALSYDKLDSQDSIDM